MQTGLRRSTAAPARSRRIRTTSQRASIIRSPTGTICSSGSYYGTLRRNTLTGPGLLVLDLSFLKNVRLAEQKNLQFRAEFFNIPNHANFGLPSSTVFDSSGRLLGTVGSIRTTETTARQVQLALRFEF